MLGPAGWDYWAGAEARGTLATNVRSSASVTLESYAGTIHFFMSLHQSRSDLRQSNMNPNRDPNAPWNPVKPAKLTHEEFELQVIAWLQEASGGLSECSIFHRAIVSGDGGEYELDGLVEFSVLGGAKIRVAVECKHHTRPVSRDLVLNLDGRRHDIGAHKAILFSTSGFQSGAVKIAKAREIALVIVAESTFLYETKSMSAPKVTHEQLGLPPRAGIRVWSDKEAVRSSAFFAEQCQGLADWLETL
ncbi:MAG: restriction endonuclease [Armatimonadetes bacterium]|nr:restriction endonuclease [Armatimonadota bacterium]